MRSAGNFHPEWGYLAPAPSFMRTARVALVATAIGATAGAAVVVSLVARPGANDDTTSIAAHALVTAAPIVNSPAVSASPIDAPIDKAPAAGAIASVSKPNAIPAPPAAAPASPIGEAPAAGTVASASKLSAAPAAPANVAALVETPQAAEAARASERPDAVAAPEAAPVKRAEVKKRRMTSPEAARRWQAESTKRWRENRGFGPLLRLFSFRGDSSYAN